MHPLLIDGEGNACQAALDGGFYHLPWAYFVSGSLSGVPVPCISSAAQRLFRTGYELREVDKHDLAQLDRLSG